YQFGHQTRRHSLITANRDDSANNIARMNRLQQTLRLDVPLADEVQEAVFVERHAVGLAYLYKDLVEQFFVRAAYFHLHLNAAQERGIHQLGRVEIGRKDDQLPERHVQRLAGLQPQVVDLAFERHDPAIQ